MIEYLLSYQMYKRASLQSLITSRIGADLFSSRLERLKESKQFQRANSQLSVY